MLAHRMPGTGELQRTVSYEDAFFSCEDWAEPTWFDAIFAHEAARVHEAGDSVASYMLGLGLRWVCVQKVCRPMEEGSPELGIGFSERSECAIRATQKANREMRIKGYGPAVLASAVVSCAGPAAEWR